MRFISSILLILVSASFCFAQGNVNSTDNSTSFTQSTIVPVSVYTNTPVLFDVQLSSYDDTTKTVIYFPSSQIDISTVSVTSADSSFSASGYSLSADGFQFTGVFTVIGVKSMYVHANGKTVSGTPLYVNTPTTGNNNSTTGNNNSTTGNTTAPTPAPTPAPVYGNGSCSSDVTITARRGGSWENNKVANQIYDIVFLNDGPCIVNGLTAVVDLPPNTNFVESWNFNTTTGVVSNFGDNIASGSAFAGAGFILSGNVTATTLSATVQASCSANCTTKDASCTTDIYVSSTARTGPGSSWATDNTNYQIYDLSIFNKGQKTLSQIHINIVLSTGASITSSWNLQSSGKNVYIFALYGNKFAPSNEYDSTSGFILSYPASSTPSVVVSVNSANC